MSKQRIVRTPRTDAIDFGIAHIEPLTSNMAAVGLQSGDISSYTLAVTKANDANIAVIQAKEALRTATGLANERWREMTAVFTTVFGKVDAFAAASADPANVWSLAQLPPPPTPGSLPEPGRPDSFKATLNEDGSVKLTWKCKNPHGAQGTVYFVRRRLLSAGPGAPWTQVAVIGAKNWTDATIPSSSGGASYSVQAQRGGSIGLASAPFTVQFGIEGGGMVIASQFTGEGAGKMAA